MTMWLTCSNHLRRRATLAGRHGVHRCGRAGADQGAHPVAQGGGGRSGRQAAAGGGGGVQGLRVHAQRLPRQAAGYREQQSAAVRVGESRRLLRAVAGVHAPRQHPGAVRGDARRLHYCGRSDEVHLPAHLQARGGHHRDPSARLQRQLDDGRGGASFEIQNGPDPFVSEILHPSRRAKSKDETLREVERVVAESSAWR